MHQAYKLAGRQDEGTFVLILGYFLVVLAENAHPFERRVQERLVEVASLALLNPQLNHHTKRNREGSFVGPL
jgi:hypothetical protein